MYHELRKRGTNASPLSIASGAGAIAPLVKDRRVLALPDQSTREVAMSWSISIGTIAGTVVRQSTSPSAVPGLDFRRQLGVRRLPRGVGARSCSCAPVCLRAGDEFGHIFTAPQVRVATPRRHAVGRVGGVAPAGTDSGKPREEFP